MIGRVLSLPSDFSDEAEMAAAVEAQTGSHRTRHLQCRLQAKTCV